MLKLKQKSAYDKKTFIGLIFFISFMLLVSSCSKTEKRENGDSNLSVPIAVAGIDQNVSVSDLVYLDASSSIFNDTANITYFWNIVTKPYQSNAELINDTLC